MEATEQPTAPYLDAVVGYAFRGPARYHVPGHKGGSGADPGVAKAIGLDGLAADVPQDIHGHRPRPVADALRARRAARRRGVRRRAHVLPHQRRDPGQPHAVPRARAAGRADRRPAQLARVDRRRPRAQRRACRASSRRSTTRSSGSPTASRRPALEAALARRAGRAGRVHRLADLLRDGRRRRRAAPRSRTAPACRSSSTSRGARTSASTTTLPPTALSQGADAMLTSTHKIAGSLTQSAMLHVGAQRPRRRRRRGARAAAAALDQPVVAAARLARRRPPPARAARRAAAARDARGDRGRAREARDDRRASRSSTRR